MFSRETLGKSECDLQVLGWCDVRWKVLWQHIIIGDVANFFGYLSGGIVAWQQRQHPNLGSMKIRKKKRDRETVLACEKRNKTSIK